jgi:hypothetical protein
VFKVPFNNLDYHIELGIIKKPIDCVEPGFYGSNLLNLKRTWVATPCNGIFIYHLKAH